MTLTHQQIRESVKMVKRSVKRTRSDGTIYPVGFGRLIERKKR